MDEIIRRSLDFIEANLKADITLADLASQAGYSTWHFGRLFVNATGLPVAQYMLRRRLEHALGEIALGGRAIEVVLSYGFETYSGFYRAFVKLYGCSPKKYLRIYGSHTITKTEVAMKHYTPKELRKVLKHWGMEKAEISNVPIMYDHRADDNAWRIGEEYCLRTGDRTCCMRDLRVTQALSAQGFGAGTPIPTLEGEVCFDGEDIFWLSRIMPGEPLRVEQCYEDNDLAYAVGQGVARLQAALKNVAADMPYDQGNLLANVFNWAMPVVQKQDEQWGMGLGEAFFTDWRERFAALYPSLPRQIIHRNLCPSCLVVREGQIEGVTQFDRLEEEVRLFDVCYAATAILSETGDETRYPAWLDVLEALLRGYNTMSPLTAEEKKAVHGMLCAIQMICVACFSEREEYRELARRNREMLLFIASEQTRIAGML